MADTSIKLEIIGDASSVEKAFKKVGIAADGMGRSVAKSGKLVGAGIAIVGTAAVAVGSKLVNMASDAAEVQSKMEVTFGKSLPGLTRNLDAFSKATGTSRYELREQVADMGALLVPLTATKQKAADMSEQFVKLATDLGSFNNVPTGDALLAIRSGLVGEAEPLRRFGVLLNEAAVKQEGLRMGLVKGKQEMTEQQKVLARASLIMKQTTLAQGDATRTAGSMANQLKRLRSNISDAATTGGKLLIPFALKLVSGFNQAFTAVGSFIDKLGKAKGFEAKIGVVFDAGKDAFASIKKALFGGWEDIGHGREAFRNGLQQVIGNAIADVDWNAAWNQASGIADGLVTKFESTDWSAVGHAMGTGLAAGVGKAAEIGQKLAGALAEASRSIDWQQFGRAMGPGLATAVVTAFATLTDPSFWIHNWDLALAVGLTVAGGVLGKIGGKLAAPLARIGEDIVLAIGGGIERFFPRLGTAVVTGLMKLPGLVRAPLNVMANGIEAIFGRLSGVAKFTVKVLGIQAVVNGVVTMSKEVYSAITGWIGKAFTWMEGAAIKAAIALIDPFSRLPSKLGEPFRAVKRDLEGRLMDMKLASQKGSKEAADKIPEQISKAASGVAALAGEMSGAGAKVGAGVKSGVLSGLGGLEDDVAARVAAAVRAGIDRGNASVGSTAEEYSHRIIGQGIANGVVTGAMQGLTALAPMLSQKIRDAIDKQRQAVEDARQKQRDAWNSYTSAALAAFDDMASKLLTKSEKLLRELDRKMTLKGIKRSIEDAKAELEAAKNDVAWNQVMLPGETTEDWVARVQAANERLANAQRAYDDALAAQQRDKLEQSAATERSALDEKIAVWRMELEKWLESRSLQQQVQLTTEGGNQTELIDKIRSYAPKWFDAGIKVGKALAKGLKETAGDVRAAVKELEKQIDDLQAKVDRLRGTSSAARGAAGNTTNGGGRASGGPVTRGVAYTVGEEGPETFIPGRSGYIVPAASSSSTAGAWRGGGDTYITNVYPQNVIGTMQELATDIHAELLALKRRTGDLGL